MITLENLTLPDELVWTDETDWTPVSQSESYLLSGALEVQTGVKLAGRVMTLGRDQGEVWARRELVLALQALAAEPAREMTLTWHDGRRFQVIFATETPVEARQVLEYNNPDAGAWYQIRALHLLILDEVTEPPS